MKIDSAGCEPGCYWFVSMSRNAYIPLGSSPQNYLSESWMINNKHIYFRLNEKINFKGFGGFFAFQVFLLFMQITFWNEKIALRKNTRSLKIFWSTSIVLELLMHWYKCFSSTKSDRQKNWCHYDCVWHALGSPEGALSSCTQIWPYWLGSPASRSPGWAAAASGGDSHRVSEG